MARESYVSRGYLCDTRVSRKTHWHQTSESYRKSMFNLELDMRHVSDYKIFAGSS